MRTLASQLIAALHYCHSAVGDKPAILHRDLKPENGTEFDAKLSYHADLVLHAQCCSRQQPPLAWPTLVWDRC